MKKLLAIALSLLMMSACFAAAYADTEAVKIGISLPTQSLERWNRDGAYLAEQFKSAGYETVLSYADNDSARQADDIMNMFSSGATVLIISAVDGEAMDAVMSAADNAGAAIIAYDRLIMNDAVDCYVSFDNYAVGRLQGQYIESALDLPNAGGKTYTIEFTAGDTADNNAGYVFSGAFDVLKGYIDAGTLNVLSKQTELAEVATVKWDADAACARTAEILSAFYTDGAAPDAWLCSNDSTAIGVAQALSSAYAGSNVIITGQDGELASLANIVDGKQSMTVYKNVPNEAVVTFAIVKAMIAGEEIGEKLAAAVGAECVYDALSYETSAGKKCPSFLLAPSVITKDNLQELVDTGLYVMGSDGYLKSAE